MKLSFRDIKQAVRKPQEQHEEQKQVYFEPFISSPIDLSPYSIRSDLWVLPNYITSSQASQILAQGVNAQPSKKWVTLRNRSLQVWGGEVTPQGLTQRESLPQWLDIFAERLLNEQIFPMKPNHVLINRYERGDGIMPHTDGPAYFPLVAIVSLGSPTVFMFWQLSPRQPEFALIIPQNSLLLFTGECYAEKMHGIEATPVDYFYTDQCGKAYVKNEETLCEVVNYTEQTPFIDNSDIACPLCGGKLSISSVLYRELRVSFTIRYVNENE